MWVGGVCWLGCVGEWSVLVGGCVGGWSVLVVGCVGGWSVLVAGLNGGSPWSLDSILCFLTTGSFRFTFPLPGCAGVTKSW